MKMTSTKTTFLQLPIAGMHCAACSTRLEKVLSKVEGVQAATVNLALEQAQLTLDKTPLLTLIEAVEKAGFSVPTHDIDLNIQGMHCAACQQRVEKVLNRQTGVVKASVNLATEKARVVCIATSDIDLYLQAVKATGFTATLVDDEPSINEQKVDHDVYWLILGAVCSIPLLLPMIGSLFGFSFGLPVTAQFVLATIVQFGLGWRFYRGAYAALQGGSSNMDVLVALGTSAAYGLSLWQWSSTDHVHHLWFESSATVITLVWFGKWLEQRAKRQTSEAIRALQSLKPEQAWVKREADEGWLPLCEVLVGDLVRVQAGERIPVDGVIESGSSQLDQSLLTGESLPVSKSTNDSVTTGALNGNGLLWLRTSAVGSGTVLSKIIARVESAQMAKPPIQKKVDQISAIFVPVVLMLALLTLVGWYLTGHDFTTSLLHAVSVLVIACPCALGLATPAAIMAGTGTAAKHGILIRDASVLEAAQHIDGVVFDKTGTLTEGKPQLTRMDVSQISTDEALAIAAALQQGSSHPLGAALTHVAQSQSLILPEITDVRSHSGVGVSGVWQQHRWSLVGLQGLKQPDVESDDVLMLASDQQRQQGKTISWLLRDQSVVAWFAFADQIKPTAKQAVQCLQHQGIQVMLLSGDHQQAAMQVAEELGITECRAEVLPEQKADVVSVWRAKGKRIAMVGDGVNDAPALAEADLGIAMGSGTDVAMASAAMTLMRNDPLAVVDSLSIARKTQQKIHQNLFWAFIYNIIALPLAMGGVLDPVFAGAAMAFSSVSVVSNALLLRRWKPQELPHA